MERLTKRSGDGGVVFPEELVGVTLTPDNRTMYKFLCRRAAYEDTGLSPQACAEAREAGKVLSNCDISFRRLAELLTADKDGRLVVLPCKVGDKIYRIQKYFNDATLQSEIKVKACVVGSVSVDSMMTDDMVFLPFDRIGKTAFLTHEEAEAALEAKRNE